MIKFKDYYIVFEEIPDKVTLAFNITNCQNKCTGCHSPELRKNIGEELTDDKISEIIKQNKGINCVLFMGEGNDRKRLLEIGKYIKQNFNICIGVYSGRNNVENEYYEIFDYIKIGPYIEKYGPLNKKTTNQRLLYKKNNAFEDITDRFWK